jgi:hypothetical protein
VGAELDVEAGRKAAYLAALLDAGHFALDIKADEIAALVKHS